MRECQCSQHQNNDSKSTRHLAFFNLRPLRNDFPNLLASHFIESLLRKISVSSDDERMKLRWIEACMAKE